MNTKPTDKATARPWKINVVNHNGWTLDGSDKPFLPLYRIGDRDDEITATEAKANGELIERAVNERAALLAVSEAAAELERRYDIWYCSSPFMCRLIDKVSSGKATSEEVMELGFLRNLLNASINYKTKEKALAALRKEAK